MVDCVYPLLFINIDFVLICTLIDQIFVQTCVKEGIELAGTM